MVDWERVYQRYLPLMERIATALRVSDLMWEMQGELGTSHAYEFGGDYRPSPDYPQGFLGADFVYDEKTNGYRITHIVHGDPWEETKDSSLNEPGINVKEGDSVLAIGGQRLNRKRSPGELLVNLGGQEVELTIRDSENGENRRVIVKALKSEREARYREFVSDNRAYVHEKTDGKIGYVHIPDMVGRGFAEFHRGYLAEISRLGLIVDVRLTEVGMFHRLFWRNSHGVESGMTFNVGVNLFRIPTIRCWVPSLQLRTNLQGLTGTSFRTASN